MRRRLLANWQHHYLASLSQGTFAITESGRAALSQEFKSLVCNSSIISSNLPKVENITISAYSGDDESEADETVKEESRVIVLPIKGTMLKYGTWWMYGMDEIAYYIKYFANREDVSAIVLDIDTGGGATNSVPPILEAIGYTKSKGKPIVSHADCACSAGQWVAAATDMVFIDNIHVSTMGSIGVMLSHLDLIPYFEELGAKYHEVYSDVSGDKNLSTRKLREGDYELIKKEMLNPAAKQFQEEIKTLRGSKLKLDTAGLLTGATFTGQAAIDAGLADKFGTLQQTINYAAAQAWANT